jgi:hypothetical protein
MKSLGIKQVFGDEVCMVQEQPLGHDKYLPTWVVDIYGTEVTICDQHLIELRKMINRAVPPEVE